MAAKESDGSRTKQWPSGQNNGQDAAATRMRLVHLTNEHANVDRQSFNTQLKEKPARAAYLSLVMRHLARDAIVIADGGAGTNIKGFRYQLWCAAREVGLRSASVLCVADPKTCKRRNRERRKPGEGHTQTEEPYEEATLDELLMRFEEPNPMTRWDSPLFVLDCNPQREDDESTWEAAPFDAIWDAVTKGEVKKAPDVVAPVRATTGNYLSLLESTTQLVLTALQTSTASGTLPEMGGQVQLSLHMQHSSPSTQNVALRLPAGKRAPSTATLQRLRRQFVKMHASSAASQNEIGFAMGHEGRAGPGEADHGSSTAHSGPSNFRAQRKVKQHNASAQAGPAKQRTPEEEIAHRFVAYLEETL